MRSTLEMIERRIGGNAASPRLEAARGIETSVGPLNTEKGVDREVFGQARIADNNDDPAVDLGLMPAEQSLESLNVAARELPQDVGLLHHRQFFGRKLPRRGGLQHEHPSYPVRISLRSGAVERYPILRKEAQTIYSV